MADRTLRAMIALLEADGWRQVKGGKGSHRKYRHPAKPQTIIVSGHGMSDEIGVGLWNKILKDAGVK